MVRTTSDNSDFKELILLLDKELFVRYSEAMDFYDQFNKIEKNDTVVLAYFKNEPIGCACIKTVSDKDAELKRMYVKPDHRGKGVGMLILAELENWARQLSYSHIILETGIKQPEAVALYNKAGYKLIDNYPPYVGVDTSICMKKAIAQ